MGDLGDVLEALHRPASYSTLRLTARRWTHLERSHEAFMADADGAVLYAIGEAKAEPVAESSGEVRVWHAAPDRWRVEQDHGYGEMIDVRAGGRHWMWHAEGEAYVQDTDEQPDCGGLLAPWAAAGALVFEAGPRVEVAGRPALTCTARPRPDAGAHERFELHTLGGGADEYHLAVDLEHGLLLRREAWIGGQPFARCEVVRIAFDEALDDGLFVFAAPDGAPIRTLDDGMAVEFLDLHEVAAQVPFTVFAAAGLDGAWELSAHVHSDGGTVNVGLHYHSDLAGYGFSIHQQAAGEDGFAPAADDPDWRTERHGDVELKVLDGDASPALFGQHAFVRLERDGTAISLQGQGIEPEALVSVALRLRPAPDAPPRP